VLEHESGFFIATSRIQEQTLIWFLVNDWDTICLHYCGIVACSDLIWLKMKLKLKTMFSKWSIVLKYTIKLELTIK